MRELFCTSSFFLPYDCLFSSQFSTFYELSWRQGAWILTDALQLTFSRPMFQGIPINCPIKAKNKTKYVEVKCDECLFHPNISHQLRRHLLLKSSRSLVRQALRRRREILREIHGLFWCFAWIFSNLTESVLEAFEKLATVRGKALEAWIYPPLLRHFLRTFLCAPSLAW